MIEINLWDEDTLALNFMALYDLTNMQLSKMIKRLCYEGDVDYVKVFCEESGVKLDKVDVASKVMFYGKIISTTVDNFNYLRQVGLVPVDYLLENDSPISRHLNQYGIEIKPRKREFVYNGKQYCIPVYNRENGVYEACKHCAYGKDECSYAGEKYRDYSCTYQKAVSDLEAKLYRDKAEIEMFLSATESEMLDYSTVKQYPEILYTIKKFIKKFFNEVLQISEDWEKKKEKTFIVTVPVAYSDMTYRTGYINGDGGFEAVDLHNQYEKYCEKEYSFTEEVPQCFWDNIWLVCTCLKRIVNYPNGSECGEICAGIKHERFFPYDCLQINIL